MKLKLNAFIVFCCTNIFTYVYVSIYRYKVLYFIVNKKKSFNPLRMYPNIFVTRLSLRTSPWCFYRIHHIVDRATHAPQPFKKANNKDAMFACETTRHIFYTIYRELFATSAFCFWSLHTVWLLQIINFVIFIFIVRFSRLRRCARVLLRYYTREKGYRIASKHSSNLYLLANAPKKKRKKTLRSLCFDVRCARVLYTI